MSIIECKELTKEYMSGENVVKAVDGITVSFEQGEFCAVTGPSGSGKSTLLHLLSSLESPTSGEVIYNDKKLSSYNDNQLSILRRRRFGFVFQAYNLVQELTGYENIILPVMLDRKKPDDEYISKIISILGIEDRLEHLPSALSGGQQQRIAIARALANKPSVLFADEPTGNLDAASGREVLSLLKYTGRELGITLILVTHDLHVAEQADRIITIEDGKIVSDTKAQGVKTVKSKLTVNTLALGNLKNRKKQYTSLIIGIILAMMFSSAIPLLFSSMVTSVHEMECDLYGNQNGIYLNASNQLFAEAVGEKVVGDYGFAHVVGSVSTDGGNPYSVAYLDDKAYQLSNISFIDGSYPQKENEIAIEEATIAKMGLDVSVGDSVTLDFLVQDGSGYLPETQEKTFVLSGIAKNKLSNIISSHSTLTDSIPSVFVAKDTQVEPGGREKLVCYFNYYEENSIFTAGNTDRYSKFSDFLDNNGGDMSSWIEADSSNFSVNSNNGIYMPTVFVSAFVGILLVASCLGIINAFSTNLNERRRQIGMLRTVGATKRQIIIIFGREAFIISLICVPLSIALSCLCVKVVFMILGDKFVFDPNIGAVAASAVLSVICVMLAALVPLIKAASVAPVQTVRNIEMTRKYVRKRIKSKKSFVPSKLIARRSLLFNGKTRAAASIILVITIIGSCYGFSMVEKMHENNWYPKYEYELQSYSWNNDLINLTGSENAYTYSDYNTVKSVLYVGDVYASRRCRAVINCGEYTDYQKTVVYSDGYFSIFDISDENIYSLTPENLDSVITSNFTEQFSTLKNYCGSQDIIPIYIIALDSRQVQELESCVASGSIDTASLDSGEEVVVIAPQKIALDVEFDNKDPDSGYSWGPDWNDGVKDDKNYLKRADCDIKAGDELSLSIISDSSANKNEDINSSLNTDTVIYSDNEELSQDNSYSDTSNWGKIDTKATVGAVVNELPDNFSEANQMHSSADIIVLTTLSGMKNFYSETGFSNINFNLKTECNDEIDADVSNTLQNIIDKKDNCSFTSYYTIIKDQQQTNSAVFILTTAILVLFLSISASIINNSLTAQIRDGRREIGTLRAVGASVRELFGSYISQLVSMLSISYAVGFVLFIVSYFIVQAVTDKIEYERVFSFSIWQTVVACVLLFIFCAVNLWLKIKKRNETQRN